MTFAEFSARPDIDKWQAIVKPLADGRRMLCGFERTNKRSRKYRIKELINPPIILDEIVKAHKLSNGSPESQPIPTLPSPT
jgi:hypothetical protein